jgi:hypothetical protein
VASYAALNTQLRSHIGLDIVVEIEDVANDEGKAILDDDLAHPDAVRLRRPLPCVSHVLGDIELGKNSGLVVGGDGREEAGHCPLRLSASGQPSGSGHP